jgi:hypothetical protein
MLCSTITSDGREYSVYDTATCDYVQLIYFFNFLLMSTCLYQCSVASGLHDCVGVSWNERCVQGSEHEAYNAV